MKKLISLLCLMPALLLAQEPVPPAQPSPDAWKVSYPGYHRHDGFYLSLSIGPALGGTVWTTSGTDVFFEETIFRGVGGLVDIKIGGAIRENLILSFDITSRTITGPEVEIDGMTGTAPDDFSVTDATLGVGITKYFMPANLFISGTLGMGQFSFEDDESNSKGESEWGPALRVKVGKEWWVGKDWGLGISGGYGLLLTKDKTEPDVDYEGEFASHQLFVLFNTTFN